ncbi:MAG TPA: AraC family transcriptional regulator [Terriglobales bacterium]
MAKIAVELEKAVAERRLGGGPGSAVARTLAVGAGWSVDDIICTSGPQDRAFEEAHSTVSIAVVAAGTFQYRSTSGRELMSPGALLLGNPGHCFECGHEHGEGDRCVAFRFAPEYFERIASDAGTRTGKTPFRVPRLAAIRPLSPLVARACRGVLAAGELDWEELAVGLAAQVLQLISGTRPRTITVEASSVARVTRAVRRIEQDAERSLTLSGLARESGLSPYHFLRVFEQVTGVTPHQYILRTRLRLAAIRLAERQGRVLDVALDSGFGDVSNFNRTFRAEFGVSPKAYRGMATLA